MATVNFASDQVPSFRRLFCSFFPFDCSEPQNAWKLWKQPLFGCYLFSPGRSAASTSASWRQQTLIWSFPDNKAQFSKSAKLPPKDIHSLIASRREYVEREKGVGGVAICKCSQSVETCSYCILLESYLLSAWLLHLMPASCPFW